MNNVSNVTGFYNKRLSVLENAFKEVFDNKQGLAWELDVNELEKYVTLRAV